MKDGNTILHDIGCMAEMLLRILAKRLSAHVTQPFDLKTRWGVPESVDPRPSFMDEYLSVAGNAGGGLDEYWDIIYQYPRIMGGAIWDFVSPGLREPVRKLTDASPNNVATHIMGRAKLVAGHDGKGIDLNGHDQWVEVYQDKNVEISGDALTVSFWIYPRDLMKMGGTMLTKGNNQFGLQQIGAIPRSLSTLRKSHSKTTVVRAAYQRLDTKLASCGRAL